jgi:hypothetical protein
MRKITNYILAIPAQLMWCFGCLIFFCCSKMFDGINDFDHEEIIE